MQETDATIITSLVSNNDNVAECLNLSISSLIEESFQYTYLLMECNFLVDNNHSMRQNTQHCFLERIL